MAEQEILQPTELDQTPETPKGKVNLVAISIFLICVSILMIIGVNAGVSLRKKQINVVIEKKLVPTVAQPTTVPNEAANWKTYTNEKYQYQISYPSIFRKNWSESDPSIVQIKPTDPYLITIDAGNNDKVTFPFEDWIKSRNDYIKSQVDFKNYLVREYVIEGNRIIGGESALVATQKADGGETVFNFINHKGQIFVITMSTMETDRNKINSYKDIFDQILSTFRFD